MRLAWWREALQRLDTAPAPGEPVLRELAAAVLPLGVTGTALALAGTATLGSFTTFSTWLLETERLVEDGDDRRAAANVAVSLVLGLSLTAGGWALGAAL